MQIPRISDHTMPYGKHGNRSQKKVKSQLGTLKHFFSCKDVKLCMKYWIYIAGPLNTVSGDLGTYQTLTATNFAHSTTLQLGEYLEFGWMRFLNAESLTNK